MTTSGIDHLFEIVETRKFCGGEVAGINITVAQSPFITLIYLHDFKLSPLEARSLAAALLAAADAAELNAARIK